MHMLCQGCRERRHCLGGCDCGCRVMAGDFTAPSVYDQAERPWPEDVA